MNILPDILHGMVKYIKNMKQTDWSRLHSFEDIFQANINKLKMRYPDGFEIKKSLVRLKGDI